MQYKQIVPARFLNRPNRFIAQVELDGEQHSAHVKNTGRCRELLLPGVQVYLEKSDNPARKTNYSLVAVEKGVRLINMDSQAPNKVVEEALRAGWRPPGWQDSGAAKIRREVAWGGSRLDFMVQDEKNTLLIEVKGVTLEEDGAVLFPDAPTLRGIKHIRELQQAVAEGCRACVLFVVQMEDVGYFAPNDRTHPAFGEALRQAQRSGVQVCAMGCRVTPETMVLAEEIPVRL